MTDKEIRRIIALFYSVVLEFRKPSISTLRQVIETSKELEEYLNG